MDKLYIWFLLWVSYWAEFLDACLGIVSFATIHKNYQVKVLSYRVRYMYKKEVGTPWKKD